MRQKSMEKDNFVKLRTRIMLRFYFFSSLSILSIFCRKLVAFHPCAMTLILEHRRLRFSFMPYPVLFRPYKTAKIAVWEVAKLVQPHLNLVQKLENVFQDLMSFDTDCWEKPSKKHNEWQRNSKSSLTSRAFGLVALKPIHQLATRRTDWRQNRPPRLQD